MTTPLRRHYRDQAAARGWRPGTSLEDWAALKLSRWGWGADRVSQQCRVGRHRLDFAWPDLRVALELDGWHHRSPDGAAKDAARDADLRAQGWLVFRVDDRGEEPEREEQLRRAVDAINALAHYARHGNARCGCGYGR